MLNTLAVSLCALTSLLFVSLELPAQTIKSLQYRTQIGDIDGIGELIEPLLERVVSGDNSGLDTPQKHLVATAAMQFHLATGDHSRAILPYLIRQHLQKELDQQSVRPLVEALDESFPNKHLPPVFFSDEDRSRFATEFKQAVQNGVCSPTESSALYQDARPDQRSLVQQTILASIRIAKENPQPRDREILKLIDHYVSHLQQHPTLAHEALATAIERLDAINRNTEADQLRAVFRSQFPDSRRLSR